ncbi:MAG: hypothetical protein H0V16_11865 [Burkholderiaceae bacterium]|nr:hypothetical protein [Burkholderiaceae bacterium]
MKTNLEAHMLADTYCQTIERGTLVASSVHPLLTTWVNGLVHQVPTFPRIDDADAALFQAIDLSGTLGANNQRLCYFAAEQIVRDVAPCILEELGLHLFADKMRALPPIASAAAAQKASDFCFEVPQDAYLNTIDRRTLMIGTLTCALTALPTSNWFYLMSNAGSTAAIYIRTARNHAQALTTMYQMFTALVESARTPELAGT